MHPDRCLQRYRPPSACDRKILLINCKSIPMIHRHSIRQSGQAVVTLLVFMVMGVTITTAGVILIVNNSRITSAVQESVVARQIAESGAENAMIRLLRDPSYTGESLTVGSGTAEITVTGSGPITIVSAGKSGNYIRKIQVIADDIDNKLTVTSWKEVY